MGQSRAKELFMESHRLRDKKQKQSAPRPEPCLLDTALRPSLSPPLALAPSYPRPEQHRKRPATGIYDCPVYKTLTRAGEDASMAVGAGSDIICSSCHMQPGPASTTAPCTKRSRARVGP